MAHDSNRPLKIIAGADSFGCSLKDALVAHLRTLNIDVEDLAIDKYYSVDRPPPPPPPTPQSRPGASSPTPFMTPSTPARFLAASGNSTLPVTAVEILDAWLRTPFKSPCPTSGASDLPPEIKSLLSNSLSEMAQIAGAAAAAEGD
ncbi:LOW QUALITY PROTEIN: hypothetical protein Scep_009540 [Stephania cephalantha]|uniref:Uncharacterized protein n=1 Tax=Stephania cephalantha TaxID=152367 RepID=A0AAP0JU16_9MAGN